MIAVMIATILVLMGAHVLEIFVWSLAYVIIGVVPAKADAMYFAFVNYTTLGYGDITPEPDRRPKGRRRRASCSAELCHELERNRPLAAIGDERPALSLKVPTVFRRWVMLYSIRQGLNAY